MRELSLSCCSLLVCELFEHELPYIPNTFICNRHLASFVNICGNERIIRKKKRIRVIVNVTTMMFTQLYVRMAAISDGFHRGPAETSYQGDPTSASWHREEPGLTTSPTHVITHNGGSRHPTTALGHTADVTPVIGSTLHSGCRCCSHVGIKYVI